MNLNQPNNQAMEISDFLDSNPNEGDDYVPSRGFPRMAWLLILAVAGVVVFTQHVAERPEPVELKAENTQESMHLQIMELQGKYLVGASQMDTRPEAKMELFEAAKPMNSGPVLNRLRFAVLAAELIGPDEGLKQLGLLRKRLLDNKRPIEPVHPLLEILYQDHQSKDWAAPSLSDEQKQQVVKELGWFGELALVPQQAKSPKRKAVLASTHLTVVAFIGGTMAALGFGFLGFSVLVLFVVLLSKKRVAFQLSGPTDAAGKGGSGSIRWYAHEPVPRASTEPSGAQNGARECKT